MVWFRLFFRDGNLPQENKPLPKEPDERKKTKTPKSKVLSLRDIMQSVFCLWNIISRYNSIENLSFCSLLYSENGCKMLSFLEILLPMLILKTFCNKNEIKLKKGGKLWSIY